MHGGRGRVSQPNAVAVVTLGCGRNDVDTDQVAGALAAAGLAIVDEPTDADVVLVNTCTFIAPARQDSIETVLAACDLEKPVLVIGCMAQRYGQELADALPEAAAVLGFSDYPRLPAIVHRVLAGGRAEDVAVEPAPGRRSLPLVMQGPASTGAAPDAPPTAGFPVRTVPRGPWAYLKIAGGCDRVCTFCTIPSFRGRYRSRPLEELLAEARWLVAGGVRELVCVSENTTSWGKDLPGGRHSQVDLVRGFEEIAGLERVRLLYLQPAEIIPELLDAMAGSPVVAGYYDLSLQHASGPILRRMARSGDAERFLSLIGGIRERDPDAVFRSSFITGFPGETEADVDVLEQFLGEAALDWTGFFTFSVEDGTPSAVMPDQVAPAEAQQRRDRLVEVAESVAEEATRRFVGRRLQVLVDGHVDGAAVGRSYREAPEVDGEVRLPGCDVPTGRMVPVQITAAVGLDLEGRTVADTAEPGAALMLGASA
ncbi:MAG: 30S ribosomal protein S12 methylthiotransferase RimO [Nitriliruptorales bacterium]|nr:30S ribosomal protein S12 methylthiotransferase RimO [Nitriliruptorales bacterium]